MRASGVQALLQMLAECGVKYIFGNPGTTELPLVDALADDGRIQYVLGLQEVPVVAMADGYALASRTPGVVNLHISCGLGNGLGMIYNAWRAGTPLIVTAGQQDRRLRFEEPILWSDMVRVARSWTKWAAEVERVQDLPAAVRRAVQTALAPPTGPVFLSLPMDVQSEVAELDLTPPRPHDPRVRPPKEALRRAAELLAHARNPAILAGSRVVEASAEPYLVRLAECLGAPVFSESGTTHGRLGFPADHPLYAQCLPLWSPELRTRLAEFDVLLAAGLDLLRLYVYFEPARALPEHLRIVHLDPDPWQLGKNYPVEVGLIGDVGAGLEELAELTEQCMTDARRSRARERAQARAAQHAEIRERLWERARQERSLRPVTPLAAMSALAEVLPPDVAVVEEAVTTTNTYLERLAALRNTTGYFGHRGWALGWGLGCAIGVQLAWPERSVLALLGEGAALYGIQGLWTAAHYKIPATFVVFNNAQYQILKVGARQLRLPAAMRNQFVGLDLVEPEIDIPALATAFGVAATRVQSAADLADAVRDALRARRPQLVELPIDRTTPGTLRY
ncbi:MAG: hypothetical protein K6T86_05015 [Pirellulales bacterium]|nr:hypothetical protein [Pirellulales bacterium]